MSMSGLVPGRLQAGVIAFVFLTEPYGSGASYKMAIWLYFLVVV